MKRLGASIYPNQDSLPNILKYIDLLGQNGFKRLFTCLISYQVEVDVLISTLSAICAQASQYQIEVFADLNKAIYLQLGEDLSLLASTGLMGIRCDDGFTAQEIATLTHNKDGLIVEINASLVDGFIQQLAFCQPNFAQLSACHNFYPMRYSGISLEYLQHCNQLLRQYPIKIAAFIVSQNSKAIGPWAEGNQVCTLEQHRDLPIVTQLKHYAQILEVDDVLIGNYPLSQEEMIQLTQVNRHELILDIQSEIELTSVEKEILFEFEHFVRADKSEYMCRSTMPRLQYSGANIVPKNTRDLHKGDVVLLNNEAGRYKAEVHLILKEMKNDGTKNVVGTIVQDEQFLLTYAVANKRFLLRELCQNQFISN